MEHTYVWKGVLPCFLAIAFCSGAQNIPSQAKATVIIFTPGGHWRGMGEKMNPFAGKAKTASSGTVFESNDAIAKMSHSRYVVINVDPGPHTFSASRTERHPSSKEVTTLNLKVGSVTYLAVTTTAPSLLAGYSAAERSHLTLSTCAAFVQDHAEDNSAPIELSQVAEKYRPLLDETFDPAHCTP